MRLDPAGISQPNRGRRAPQARHFLAMAAGLAVLLSAGCGGSSTSGGADSATVTIAAVPGIADAPLYLAKKDGLFAAAGLSNVVIKSYPNQAAALDALHNSQADIAGSDYGNIFYQQSQSQSGDLRILAAGYAASSGVLEVLTLPSSSIASPLDLANQRVGLPSDDVLPIQTPGEPISLEAAAATRVLTDYLANGADSVQWVPMTQEQEIYDLVHHRDGLKAILLSEPYIYQAESTFGAVEVFDVCSGYTANLPLSGYVSTSAWVQSNPVAVADFRAAIAKAQAQASMVGPIEQVLPAAADMSAQHTDLATIGSYPTTTSANELDRVERLMWQAKMIKTVNVQKMLVG